MTTNVRLKVINKNHIPTRQQLTEVAYGKLNVPFTRIFTTGDGYKAVCRNSNEADVILSQNGVQAFSQIGLQVLMPPEIRAQRSVFIRRLDQHFGKHTAEEMKAEIEDKNQWIKIDEITKIKDYTHVVKIRFAETAITDRVLESGFLAFNMSVLPNQIEREKFVNLLTCFNCYQYQDHATKDCPNKDIKVCSECAEIGHSYKDCQEGTPKACINCKKQSNPLFKTHRTLAMSCPIKKTLIKEKTEEDKMKEEAKKNTTYAAIAKKAVEEAAQPQPAVNLVLSDVKHYDILICLMYAHVMNLATPGVFEEEMNNMLKTNGLPQMKFPSNPPSGKILHVKNLLEQEVRDELLAAHEIQEKPMEAARMMPQDSAMSHESVVEIEQQTQDSACDTETTIEPIAGVKPKTTTSRDVPRKQKMDTLDTAQVKEIEEADDLGLTLYYHDDKVHPSNVKTLEDIAQAVVEKKYKWSYNNAKYTEHLVENYILNKQIKFRRHNFKRIDEGTYKNISNGLDRRSSPASQSKSKRVKK